MTDRTNWPSPCALCGYNGPGFHQPKTHACARFESEREALIHEIGTLQMQVEMLRAAVLLGKHYLKGRYPIPVKEKEVLERMQAALDTSETQIKGDDVKNTDRFNELVAKVSVPPHGALATASHPPRFAERWHVEKDGSISDRDNNPILYVHTDSEGSYLAASPADRKLAAAAPELKEVCEALVSWWFKDGISGTRELDGVVDMARDVLHRLKAP